MTGSEAVGLVPLQAMLDAANYYIEKENLFIIEEDQKVHLAINRLGLSTLSPFKPKERIIEYCLEQDDGPLVSQTVRNFIRSVGDRTTAPGGGSVSALVGALVSSINTGYSITSLPLSLHYSMTKQKVKVTSWLE